MIALFGDFILKHWKLFAAAAVAGMLFAMYQLKLEEAYDKGYKAAETKLEKQMAENTKKAQAKIAEIDKAKTKEIEDAKKESDTLRADLLSSRRRLSVNIVRPQPSGSTGVGDGETRADIDSRDAEAIIAITTRGDEAIRQLGAAQEILDALIEKDREHH